MNGIANNLGVVLKPLSKMDNKKADGFFESSFKLRASLSIYTRAIFNILPGQEQPSETDDSQATAGAAWYAARSRTSSA